MMDDEKARPVALRPGHRFNRRQGGIYCRHDPTHLSVVFDLETVVGVSVVGHFPDREQLVEKGGNQGGSSPRHGICSGGIQIATALRRRRDTVVIASTKKGSNHIARTPM
jgi:hypothetical protein